MHFDTVLKETIMAGAGVLLQRLTGSRPLEWLTIEIPSVKSRRVDLVCRLVDGRILHLELQSSNDPRMIWRMHEAYPYIFERYEVPPVQTVLYVGRERARMQASVEHLDLTYRFHLIDIRDLDGEELLSSMDLGDNLLAILAQMRDRREAVRRVLERITRLEGRERADALTRLLVLSGLRGMEEMILEGSRHMPVLIDPMENTVLKRWHDEAMAEGMAKGRTAGKAEGRAELLLRLLNRKYGPLPVWAQEQVLTAAEAELDEWGLRLLDAPSLEECLGR